MRSTPSYSKKRCTFVGAKFVEIDLGETDKLAQGYAKALTEDNEKARDVMKQYCAQSDIVYYDRSSDVKAPVIVTNDMIGANEAGFRSC